MLTLPEVAPSRNRAFLKAWQDVILGRRELAAGKPLVRKGAQGFGAVHLMAKYKEEAAAERPLVRLEIKLKGGLRYGHEDSQTEERRNRNVFLGEGQSHDKHTPGHQTRQV